VPGRRIYLLMQSNFTLTQNTLVYEDNIRPAAICLNLAGTKGEIN